MGKSKNKSKSSKSKSKAMLKEIKSQFHLWDCVSSAEQAKLRVSALALFPELLGDSPRRFDKLTLWLATVRNIVSPSLRDFFLVRGRVTIPNLEKFGEVPRILLFIDENKTDIISYINNVGEVVLSESWGVSEIEKDRIGQWISILPDFAKFNGKAFPVREIVESILG